MSYVEKVQGGSSVNWGGMIAGAAVVTGAVLMAPALTSATNDTIPEAIASIFNSIKTTIASWFASPEAAKEAVAAVEDTAGKVAEKGVFESIGATLKDFGSFVKDNAKELGGATLIGGGAAGLMMGGKEKAYVVNTNPMQLAHSHVENEQMRAINGLMKARMMAANPEFMAQAMGGRA